MVKYDIKKTGNNTLLIQKGLKKVNVSDDVEKIISKLKNRIEREIPDTGYFRNFAEDFKNQDKNLYAKACSLSIERDETIDGKALLLANVLHPQRNIEASVMLCCGDRKELLKYMNKDGFSEELLKSFLDLAESLKKR